ncbi:MAG TPA: hypothetical protein VKZ68_02740 [Ohtaekwangia sp.]|nr:hypothetical protein [Ohtaekwangia sp.]
MNEDDNNLPEDYKPLTDLVVIKFLAIMFVLGVYGVIFLKILILK